MMRVLYLVCIALFSLLTACQSTDQPSAPNQALIDEFEAFYAQFHQDSAFQLEHISFPLASENKRRQQGEQRSEQITWTQENWRLHQAINFSGGEYARELTLVNSTLIEEEIRHKTGMFVIFRRFQKSGGEWELIYYATLNNVSLGG